MYLFILLIFAVFFKLVRENFLTLPSQCGIKIYRKISRKYLKKPARVNLPERVQIKSNAFSIGRFLIRESM